MLDITEIPFFSKLPREAIQDVRAVMELRSFSDSSTIFRKGEVGKYFCAIASGGVNVILPGVNRDNRVFMGPGNTFGEMSLLMDMPISAAIQAAKETYIYMLSKHAFLHLLESHPEIHKSLAEMLINRLRHRSGAGTTKMQPACCFVVSSAPADQTTRFLETLSLGIDFYNPGSCLIDLTRESKTCGNPSLGADRLPLPEFIPEGKTVTRLSDIGKSSNPNAFEASPSPEFIRELVDKWKERESGEQTLLIAVGAEYFPVVKNCLNRNDLILGLALPSHISDAYQMKQSILNDSNFTLVQLGDEGSFRDQFGTSEIWRHRVSEKDLSVVAPGKPESKEIDWISRWVTKREIGIALSAGAARGFAHLGVLEVIEKAGIQLDCISGSSMGGIVTLIYAMTGNATEAIAIVKELAGSNKKIRDISLIPHSSFMKGKKVERAARNALGERLIGELKLPCSVVAADLVRGDKYIINHGSAAVAALATSSIPGAFPPITIGEHILVDGGLVSRIPVDLLDQRRCGMKIAVNVIPSPHERKKEASKTFRTLTKTLTKRLSFKTVMAYSWDLQGWSHGASEAQNADLMIEPNTDLYSGFDFDSFDQMVEAGRKSAEEKIDLIKTAANMALRPGAP